MSFIHNISWSSFLAGALFVQFLMPFLLGLLRRRSTPTAAAAA